MQRVFLTGSSPRTKKSFEVHSIHFINPCSIFTPKSLLRKIEGGRVSTFSERETPACRSAWPASKTGMSTTSYSNPMLAIGMEKLQMRRPVDSSKGHQMWMGASSCQQPTDAESLPATSCDSQATQVPSDLVLDQPVTRIKFDRQPLGDRRSVKDVQKVGTNQKRSTTTSATYSQRVSAFQMSPVNSNPRPHKGLKLDTAECHKGYIITPIN